MLIHYVFVRRDLPLGVLAAMVTHAAGESGGLYGEFPDHCIAVVLEAKTELHLEAIMVFLRKEGIPHIPIYESSEPYANQLMSIGIVPCERALLGDKLESFQTLKTCDSSTLGIGSLGGGTSQRDENPIFNRFLDCSSEIPDPEAL